MGTMKIISSFSNLDDGVVTSKMLKRDFTVSLSPPFEVEGISYQVVLDGHHALVAAKIAGEDAEYVELDTGSYGPIGLLDQGRVADFLMVVHAGDDWCNVDTGRRVWQ